MINNFKKIVFYIYLAYCEKFPISRGKYRLGQWLTKMLNSAVYEIGGVKLELNPIALIDRKLILEEGHDPVVLENIVSQLNKGGILLDIGANFGYFSITAASLPNVNVISFEPSPRELSRLYRNISLNNFTNINVFPYGLSEEIQTLCLKLASNLNPGKNSVLDLQDLTGCPEIKCQFFPLDRLLPQEIIEEIRVCKIDVEGFEVPVLRGMSNAMKYMRNVVFVVEISPQLLIQRGNLASEIYNFFESYEYKPKFGINSHTVYKSYDEVFSKSNH